MLTVNTDPPMSPIRLRILFSSYPAPRNTHSFPTRRSSDLGHQRDLCPLVAREFVNEHQGGGGAADERATCFAIPGRHLDEIGRAHVWNSSHVEISYAVFCLKKKTKWKVYYIPRTQHLQ